MYLLSTSSYTLQFFADADIPDYAILSHRWGKEEDEVLYRHIRDGSYATHVGFPKVRGCCETARRQGWEYVWIDSCCIDKTSSVDLTEAINSMYRYYRNAQVCYAYLNDVPSGGTNESWNPFRESVWFTRGWTLQELIAPRMVIFYDQGWEEIGTRSSLRETIGYITGIHRPFASIEHATVAEKMSWASSRRTLRIEDSAYCLLGLFGISMPLLYGEGVNAFLRLQLEIMNKTNNDSIFAWNINKAAEDDYRGLLAYTPAAFSLCGDVGPSLLPYKRPPSIMTNRGLRMDALLIDGGEPDVKIAVLDCRQGDRIGYLGVYLRELAEDEYCRIRCSELALCEVRLAEQLQPKARQIFIRQYGPLDEKDRWKDTVVFDTSLLALQGFMLKSLQVSEPRNLLGKWSLESEDIAAKKNTLRTIELPPPNMGRCSLKLRSQKGGPACAIMTFQDAQKGDAFALLIESVDGQVGADIILLEDDCFEPLMVQRLFKNRQYIPLYDHRADRVSRWMWSNRSVSVELLNLNSKDTSCRSGPYFLARLSVDIHGGLSWPDIDNDNYITRDHKIFRVVEKGRPQEYWAHTKFINSTDDEEQQTGCKASPSDEVQDPFEAARQYLARYEWCQRFFPWWPSRSTAPSPSASPPAPPYMGLDLLSLHEGIRIKEPSRKQIELKRIAESFLWRHDVQGRIRYLSDSDMSSVSNDDRSIPNSSECTTDNEFSPIGSPRLEYWQHGIWTNDADLLQEESKRPTNKSLPSTLIFSGLRKREQVPEWAQNWWDSNLLREVAWTYPYPESPRSYDYDDVAPPYQLIDIQHINGDFKIVGDELASVVEDSIYGPCGKEELEGDIGGEAVFTGGFEDREIQDDETLYESSTVDGSDGGVPMDITDELVPEKRPLVATAAWKPVPCTWSGDEEEEFGGFDD